MSDWKGIVGTGFTRDEFANYIASITWARGGHSSSCCTTRRCPNSPTGTKFPASSG